MSQYLLIYYVAFIFVYWEGNYYHSSVLSFCILFQSLILSYLLVYQLSLLFRVHFRHRDELLPYLCFYLQRPLTL